MSVGNAFKPRCIAVLGLGEAGSTLVSGLCQSEGWRDAESDRRVIAIDTEYGIGDRGQRMRALCQSLSVSASADYTHALNDADLVISVVTGEAVEKAASMARPWLGFDSLFADFNSITGPHTRRVAAVLSDSDTNFVDVGVMGSFKGSGHRVPLLIAGPRATDFMSFANSANIPVKKLSERIGDASAVKILRSILMKGIEALSVECLVAARRQGLVEELLDNVGDVDTLGFAEFVKVLTITHPTHALRRMQEVEKAIDNLDETGVPALMSDAIRRNHQRTVDAGFETAQLVDLDLDAVLKLLDERLFAGPTQ